MTDMSQMGDKDIAAYYDRLVYRAGLQMLKEFAPAAAIGRLLRALALEKPKTKGGRPKTR